MWSFGGEDENKNRDMESIDEKFFKKSRLTDLEWNRVLCRWEDLIGIVYADMWDNFPGIMSVDLIDLLLERERDIT